MKYNYFALKLERFYQEHKVLVISCLSVIFIAAIVYAVIPQSRESKIKSAINRHHASNGRNFKIELLSFRPAKNSFTDSICLVESLNAATHYIEQRYKSDNSQQRDSIYADSINLIAQKIDSLRQRVKSNTAAGLIKCEYSITYFGNSKYTDTLTAILDTSFTVIWPAKK